MRYLKLSIAFLLSFIFVHSQTSLKKDRESIMKMCGCFQIEFNFTETFQHSIDKDYKPSDEYYSTAFELAIPIKLDKKSIKIQHLLIVGKDSNRAVIKHWRQDWIYQNQDIYNYYPDNSWVFSKLNQSRVKGQWTQKVFQVDDSPRYQGSSTWVHIDGKSYWENTTNAPLPRREYTKRNDYNLLKRTNRHEITQDGWVHIQDNKKILSDSNNQILLSEEKGFSTYKRVDKKKCDIAYDWWVNNESKWSSIRTVWDNVYKKEETINLKKELNGRKLYEYLLFSNDFEKFEEQSDLINNFIVNLNEI
jgi:hypothetical protein